MARYAIKIKHWTDALFSVALPASFYAIAWLGLKAVIHWDHNSFTLPAGSLLLLAMLVTFRSGQQVPLRLIVALGFGTGVLTATQLYFMTWLIGLIVIIASFHLLQRHSWVQAVQSSIYAVLGASLGFVVVTLPIINHYDDFFTWIKGIILHHGLYGSGEPGIISSQLIWTNLIQMWNYSAALCIALPLVMLTLGLAFFLEFSTRKQEVSAGVWALTFGLSTQVIVTLTIILKHYQNHYLLAVAAILPLLLALVHTLFLESSIRRLRTIYALVSIVVFTGFIYRITEFVSRYQDAFRASYSAQQKTETFFKEYAAITGKDHKALKLVWSLNTYSSCFARWHNSREYHGVFDKEISEICPRDFYLLLYSPYVYLAGQHVLLEDFDWDLVVVAQEFLPQWPYLMDYGYVSSNGDLVFIVNWKHLYSLTGNVTEEAYQGYNIFSVGRFFFGISQSDGGLSFERLQRSDYRDLVEGATLKEVQGRIATLSAPSEQVPKPTLIMEWYRGYRIFRLRDRFYAIRHRDFQLDLERFWARDHINRVEAGTLEKVKERVDALWRPEVIVLGYRGYDIYRSGQTFYAIRQSDGGFDLKRFHMGRYVGYVKASSIDEAKKRIDALVRSTEQLSQQKAARLD